MRAALPYLGGKRRLLPHIFAALAAAIPVDRWRGATLADPFLGGGSVSLSAKALGFAVLSNDLASRSAVVGRALIANSTARITQPMVAAAIGDEIDCEPAPGYSPAESAVLRRLLAGARRYSDSRRDLLMLEAIKLALRLRPMSLPGASDAKHAAAAEWDRISPRRLRHYADGARWLHPQGLLAIADEINSGVFPGRGSATQLDAGAFLRGIRADAVYADPPYTGTASYPVHYRWLDELLDDRSAVDSCALDLEEIVAAAARAAPVLVMSFGGPSRSAREALERSLHLHFRSVDLRMIPYRHLHSLNSPTRKDAENFELLYLARR